MTVSFNNNTDGVEFEPNDSPNTAQSLPLGTDLQGSISSAEDQDYYQIVVTKPGQLTIGFKSLGLDYTGWSYSVVSDSGKVLSSRV